MSASTSCIYSLFSFIDQSIHEFFFSAHGPPIDSNSQAPLRSWIHHIGLYGLVIRGNRGVASQWLYSKNKNFTAAIYVLKRISWLIMFSLVATIIYLLSTTYSRVETVCRDLALLRCLLLIIICKDLGRLLYICPKYVVSVTVE